MENFGFVNLTPFAALPLPLSDERGADVLTFVAKGTFRLDPRRPGSPPALADEQAPLCLEPVHYGDPAASSLKYDLDTAVAKVGTDVVLVGHARAPRGGATWLDVSLAVGPARAAVRVLGNRVWTKSLGQWVPTPPEPFEAIPLVYERAFGGWDRSSANPAHHDFDPRNPVGVGFVSKKHGTVPEGAPLPNIEDPRQPMTSPGDRPPPAGFGFVGAHWQPRASFAGTYDDQWQQRRMPLLPDDFDRRFYNAASPGLALQGFLGGSEPVEVHNASPHGPLRFALPTARPYATVRMKDGTHARAWMALDTVVINTDEDKLLLVWRGSIPVHRRVHDVVWSKAQLAPGGDVS